MDDRFHGGWRRRGSGGGRGALGPHNPRAAGERMFHAGSYGERQFLQLRDRSLVEFLKLRDKFLKLRDRSLVEMILVRPKGQVFSI